MTPDPRRPVTPGPRPSGTSDQRRPVNPDPRRPGTPSAQPPAEASTTPAAIDLAVARGPAVGGKAGPLAELLRTGFDVPPGFVVPTDLFRDALAALPGTGTPASSPPGPDSGRAVRGDAGPEVREQILAAELPPRATADIATALDRLTEQSASGCVAVRSSSSSEDTDRSSAAGQHHSALAVRGRAGVIAAIRACWASTFSDRAVAYRARPAAENGTDEMAVLVQEWIDPEVAGVMFTHPRGPGGPGAVTTVEATWGIGEGLVSGRVTPDSWTVDETGVRARRIGSKAERGDRVSGRIITKPVPEADRTRPCLTDDDVRRLHGIGVRIVQALGGARDIEWALADGRLWILQARPVTAELPSGDPAAPAVPAAGAQRAGAQGAADRDPAGDPPRPDDGAGPAMLHGVAGAAGTASGPVRHVCGPADFRRVRPGDVLVCRETDPAWTPLFTVAAAVVTETGGLLSHAAIVAREVGIPAVLAVPGASTALVADVLVRVDGNSGTVCPVSE